MILVDTTVLIDTLKGVQNHKSELFKEALKNNEPYCISEYTFLEVLQGAKTSSEYNSLRDYLLDMHIFMLPKNTETYDAAAQVYFSLRRQGVTPRSTIDVLIALTAIKYDLLLLHNDKDFDEMALKLPQLKIY